jgi:hypothetical protein
MIFKRPITYNLCFTPADYRVADARMSTAERQIETFITPRPGWKEPTGLRKVWIALKRRPLTHSWWPVEYDNCQVCRGASGGVKGNENIIDGLVVCDYCHAWRLRVIQETD